MTPDKNWTEEDIGKIIHYKNYVFGEENKVAIAGVDKDITGRLIVVNHPIGYGSKIFYTDVPKKDQRKLDASYFKKQGDYSIVGEVSKDEKEELERIRKSSTH